MDERNEAESEEENVSTVSTERDKFESWEDVREVAAGRAAAVADGTRRPEAMRTRGAKRIDAYGT